MCETRRRARRAGCAVACHGHLGRVALLRYNPSSGAKYEWLGRPYRVAGRVQRPERLTGLVEIARRMGLEAAAG